MKASALVALAAGLMLAGQVGAADYDPLAGGDPASGQTKAATCAACHGADGNSINGEWPNLAGQHAAYLKRQLVMFKSGGRQNAVMLGLASVLSEEDMADIAAYYSQQELKPGVADESLVALGAEVYRSGAPERSVPACAGCHGPGGRGNPLAGYPSLRAQQSVYLAATLRAFRDGAVWGKDDNANAVMSGVAAGLTDEEIDALASYLQGLWDTPEMQAAPAAQ